jgi:hypothetical protein
LRVIHEHVARILAQATAAAIGAGCRGQELGEVLAYRLGFRVAVASLHIGQDALEVVPALEHGAAIIDVGEGDLLVATAVEDDLTVLLPQLPEGRVDVEAVVLCQGVRMWK